LSHPAVSTVIPGIRTVKQVEDNIAASGKQLLPEDLERLRAMYRKEFRHLPFH
jgi:aryl-alcohol dehydrogenase-like predicted oxidoreductase